MPPKEGFTLPLETSRKLSESIIVARVQPRTSKGITDLLLPQTSLRYFLKRSTVPLRSKIRKQSSQNRLVSQPVPKDTSLPNQPRSGVSALGGKPNRPRPNPIPKDRTQTHLTLGLVPI